MMYYRECPPNSALSPFVRCYWHMAREGRLPVGTAHRVLPDGCVDVLFNLSDSFHGMGPGQRFGQSTYVIGAMLQPTVVRFGRNLDVVGVRFRPGGAYPFLQFPLYEITDRVLPLDDLPDGAHFALDKQLAETRGLLARIRLLDEALLSRLDRLDRLDRQRRTLAWLVSSIVREDGRVSVADLQQSTGISARQLERRFKTRTGLTLKSFCRIVRFRAALATLKRHPVQRWAEFACGSGFYDQAHLIREFKRLTGLTPAAYLRERANVAFVQSHLLRRG